MARIEKIDPAYKAHFLKVADFLEGKTRPQVLRGVKLDMGVIVDVGECGTAACIGGLVQLLSGRVDRRGNGMRGGIMTMLEQVTYDPALHNRLYNLCFSFPNKLTRREAANAIRRVFRGLPPYKKEQFNGS